MSIDCLAILDSENVATLLVPYLIWDDAMTVYRVPYTVPVLIEEEAVSLFLLCVRLFDAFDHYLSYIFKNPRGATMLLFSMMVTPITSRE